MMKKLNLPTAKFAIVNDLTKRIRDDSAKLAENVAYEINDFVEKTDNTQGKVEVSKNIAGANVKAKVKVPLDNAADFALKVDDAINKTFRFGKWSDMRIK